MKIDKKIYIWGTGKDAERLAQYHPVVAFKCECFIDSDERKWGKIFLRKEVIAPTKIDYEDRNAIIIIATGNYFEDIRDYLLQRRFSNYIKFDAPNLLYLLWPNICRDIEDKERKFNWIFTKYENMSQCFLMNVLRYLSSGICTHDNLPDSCGIAYYCVDTNIYELLILSDADYDEVKVFIGGYCSVKEVSNREAH